MAELLSEGPDLPGGTQKMADTCDFEGKMTQKTYVDHRRGDTVGVIRSLEKALAHGEKMDDVFGQRSETICYCDFKSLDSS